MQGGWQCPEDCKDELCIANGYCHPIWVMSSRRKTWMDWVREEEAPTLSKAEVRELADTGMYDGKQVNIECRAFRKKMKLK